MAETTIRVHARVADARSDLETAGLAGYAFQSHTWLETYQDTLGRAAGTRPAIVTIAEGGRVVMVVPLAVSTRLGLRTLEFLGGGVTDYNAPLVAPAFAAGLDPAGLDRLWRRIVAALPPHDVVRLVRMPADLDPPAGSAAAVPNPLARLTGARAAGQAWSLAMAGDHPALLASLKTSFAADLRRRRKRLAAEGPVALVVAEDVAAMERVVAALRPMKSRRWRDTGNRDHFADPAFRAFYERIGQRARSGGHAHGSVLTVGETVVAAHLGLVHRGRYYYLMMGWEAGAWQRCSTGRLMVDALIRWSCENGFRQFDFTVGDEAYKRGWVDTELPLTAYEAAATLRGRAALSALAAARDLRARAKRIAWLRRAVRRLAGRPPLDTSDTAA